MGDCVRLQQALPRLIMIGFEAMRGITGRARELTVSTRLAEPGSMRKHVTTSAEREVRRPGGTHFEIGPQKHTKE
jgi:hypothetical protein